MTTPAMIDLSEVSAAIDDYFNDDLISLGRGERCHRPLLPVDIISHVKRTVDPFAFNTVVEANMQSPAEVNGSIKPK